MEQATDIFLGKEDMFLRETSLFPGKHPFSLGKNRTGTLTHLLVLSNIVDRLCDKTTVQVRYLAQSQQEDSRTS